MPTQDEIDREFRIRDRAIMLVGREVVEVTRTLKRLGLGLMLLTAVSFFGLVVIYAIRQNNINNSESFTIKSKSGASYHFGD